MNNTDIKQIEQVLLYMENAIDSVQNNLKNMKVSLEVCKKKLALEREKGKRQTAAK